MQGHGVRTLASRWKVGATCSKKRLSTQYSPSTTEYGRLPPYMTTNASTSNVAALRFSMRVAQDVWDDGTGRGVYIMPYVDPPCYNMSRQRSTAESHSHSSLSHIKMLQIGRILFGGFY
ncbi:UNVERIFIED_CONTAM: hypothetical protein Sangu_2070700 [Sesamum angustifolium]|uniref:Uncharacterized protein n=1 Tax=Sesamum angustifolium TaxID=2727405 RepID=A0AAW2LJ33_9LAMI